jgi:hypothetical protein
MKKFNNTLNALIGIWFVIAPWVLNFSDHSGAVRISVIIGAILLLSSLFSFKAPVWNFVSCIAGGWFIIFPFFYMMDSTVKWTSVALGAIAVYLNLTND